MAKGFKFSAVEAIYNSWQSILTILGLILVAVGLAALFRPPSSSPVEIIKQEEQEKTGELIVDIAGAVINPGVYTLKGNSRLNDLLIACGGLSAEADREWVEKNLNRAAPLVDGAKIYLPKIGEEVGQAAGESKNGLININQADQALLETLPGIGPATAKKIIDYRTQTGSFSSVEELMSVSGIGPKTFGELKDLISVY